MKKHCLLLVALLTLLQLRANINLNSDDFPFGIAETATITPTFNITSSICSGATAPILPQTSNNGITGTWSPSTVSNIVSQTYVFTPTQGQDAVGVSVSVTVNPLPAMPQLSVMQPNCAIATGTLVISGVSGETYSFDNFPYSSTLVYPALPAGSNHTVTAKNAAGCVSAVAGITVNAQPSTPLAPIVTISYQSCSSATITITGVSGEIYELDGAAYSSNLIYSGLPVGSTHNIAAENAAGCISTVTSITINSPITNFPSNTTICSGSTLPMLSSTFPNGVSGTWSPSTVSNVVSGNYVFTPSASFSSCISPYTFVVAVLLEPNAGTSGNIVVCENNTTPINLFDIITGEQPGGTWIRISGTGGVFNAAAGTFTPGPGATTTTISFTVTGTAPCVNDSSTATIEINAAPNPAALSGNQNVCIGLTTTFSATVSGGTWTTSNPAIATVNALTGLVTAVSPGTATISYTISGNGGCSNAVSTRTVSVNFSGNLVVFCDPSQAIGPNSVFFDWTVIPGTISYQYSYSIEGAPSISGTTSISHYEVFGVSPGQSVAFTLTAQNSPCVPTVTVNCNAPLASESFEAENSAVYPNPVKNILNLEYPRIISEVSIFNIYGQMVWHQLANTKKLQADLSDFGSGVYLVKVVSGIKSQTFKVFKT